MKKKENFYQTTALVTFCSVLERALGFLYRVVLARLLGAEGLGIYQIALSHFAFFRTIGGGGLPVVTSRLIAKEGGLNSNNDGGVLTAAALLSLALTLPITLLVVLLPFFSSTLKILIAVLSFTCLYGVVKGFYWGHKNFLFPALLEMAEEILTVLIGVVILRLFGQNCTAIGGANLASIAAVVACALVAVLSFFLLFTYPKNDRKLSFQKGIFREVAGSALPITGMRATSALLSSAIAVLLPVMLVKSGMTQAQATAAFGVATGMAFPLLSMPLTLVGSFALVLMPKLAEDYYQNNLDRLYKNVERGLTCAIFVACLLLPFFFSLGENIGLLTYENALAGELLKKGCLLLLPMSFCMISNTALNSMGFEKKTLFFYLAGAAAMLLCVFLLPAVCGIYAYIVGLLAQYLISGTLSAFALFKKRRPSARFLRKIFLALFFCLPLSFLGQGCAALFARFCGVWLAMTLTATVITVVSLLLYMAFELFLPAFVRKIFTKE